MAYLAKIEPQDSRPIALPTLAASKPDFSALEWSVIRFARLDRLWTIRTAGRIRRFWNWVLARGNPELADPGSRRFAGWRFSPGTSVSPFPATTSPTSSPAGFSPDQYELMAGWINSALSAPRRIAA